MAAVLGLVSETVSETVLVVVSGEVSLRALELVLAMKHPRSNSPSRQLLNLNNQEQTPFHSLENISNHFHNGCHHRSHLGRDRMATTRNNHRCTLVLGHWMVAVKVLGESRYNSSLSHSLLIPNNQVQPPFHSFESTSNHFHNERHHRSPLDIGHMEMRRSNLQCTLVLGHSTVVMKALEGPVMMSVTDQELTRDSNNPFR